jgi:RHS repeat-associated protein
MEYTFDKVGNIVRTENTASQKTIIQEYGYDDIDELTSAKGSYEDRSMRVAPVVRTTYTQMFEYDIIGNMTKKTSSQSVTPGRNKPELNYALDYTYSLTRAHSALKIGDYGYQYDANGNVTAEIYGTNGRVARRTGSGEFEDSDDSDPTIGHVMYNFSDVHPDNPAPGTVVKSYVWDEENRMKEAVNGREHVYFGYDAGGERTVKWSEHGETVYLDRMYQVETSTHPALYTKHIFVGDTRLISRIGDEGGSYGGQDAEMYYYHADHLGSSNWVTDNQGAEYEHLEYAPYGESWVEEGRDSLNRIDHLFTGKELDDETGLYYFGARYMDPKTSRWMSADPKGSELMDPKSKEYSPIDGINWYAYCSNNPLNYIDPNGENPWKTGGPTPWGAINGILNAWADHEDNNIYMLQHLFDFQYWYDIAEKSLNPMVVIKQIEEVLGNIKQAIDSGDSKRISETVSYYATTAMFIGIDAKAAAGIGKAFAGGQETATANLKVATPYGDAVQATTKNALNARTQVGNGTTLYRLGTTGKSAAGEAQFWSLENPLSPGYASIYGLPAGNISNANFIETATLKPGAKFITRPAPGIGSNPGGGIEVVVPPGGVNLQTFSTIP